MKSILNASLFGALMLLTIFSCSKDPEAPKPPEVEYPVVNKTIQDLRNLVTGDEAYVIPDNFVFKGIVISNQSESNNFYRALYLQSGDYSIKLSCNSDGSTYESFELGQEVYVTADGLSVAKYYDTYTLGYDASGDRYKVSMISDEKLALITVAGETDKNIVPNEINDLSTLTTDMVGTLVKVNNVQVVESDREALLGDSEASGYTTLTFTKANGKQIQLSNSNYSNFSDSIVPDGSGAITGILNTFGTDFQIALRSVDDLNLKGERFEVNIPLGDKISIADLRSKYTDSDITIEDELYIEGIITFTPSEGNIPDFIAYIQDESAAITLTESGSNSFTKGSKIRVKCNGLTLTEYNGLLQLGSIDYSSMVDVVEPTGSEVTPRSVTIADITNGSYQSQLVQISDVQFSSVPGTFSGSQTLTDCTDNIAVYTRSGASFSGDALPEGNGTLIGIASSFNSAQILLRDPAELNMTGERCSGGGGGPGNGSGTKEDPFDVPYVLSAADDGSISGWVKGYIIGTIPATGEATLTPPFDVATNMLIAATADETNVDNMVSVQLPSGSIRTALNLVDNESNLGKEVLVLGSLEWYYGFSGVKSLTGYWLDGAGIDPDNRTEDAPTPETDYPAGSFFFENFENAMEDMDIYITGWDNKAESGERNWQGNMYSNNSYAQASAYNSTDATNDMWLVTPSISLDGKTNPTFKCDLKGGYDNGATIEVYVLTDYDGNSNPWDATATQLNITLPSVPSGGYGDNFESSGDMDLSSFSGNIHIAFKYIGSTSQTTTWQVDNINCFEK